MAMERCITSAINYFFLLFFGGGRDGYVICPKPQKAFYIIVEIQA